MVWGEVVIIIVRVRVHIKLKCLFGVVVSPHISPLAIKHQAVTLVEYPVAVGIHHLQRHGFQVVGSRLVVARGQHSRVGTIERNMAAFRAAQPGYVAGRYLVHARLRHRYLIPASLGQQRVFGIGGLRLHPVDLHRRQQHSQCYQCLCSFPHLLDN